MAVHQEFLWALGRTVETIRGKRTEIVYRLCKTQSECYRVVVEEGLLGDGFTGKHLAALGWKPVRVFITADLPQ